MFQPGNTPASCARSRTTLSTGILTLALLLGLLGTSTLWAAPGDEAIETYKTVMRVAAGKLLNAINAELEEVSKQGNRRRVKRLLSAKRAFRFDGEEVKLPSLIDARGEYRRSVRLAQRVLVEALNNEIKRLLEQDKRKEVVSLRKQKRILIKESAAKFLVPRLLKHLGGERGEVVRKFEPNGDGYTQAHDFSDEGQYLVCGRRKARNAIVYDLVNDNQVKLGHSHRVWNAKISPNNEQVLTVCAGSELNLWDWRNKRLIKKIEGPKGWTPVKWPQLAFVGYGGSALVSSEESLLWVDLTTGETLWHLKGFSDIQRIRVLGDGFTAMAFDRDAGKFYRIDLLAKRTSVTLSTEEKPLSGNGSDAAGFSRNARIAITKPEHKVLHWNLEDGRILRSLSDHEHQIYSAAISPDGRFLLSASDHNQILWDLRDYHKIGAFQFFKVRSAEFSPFGHYFVTGSHPTLRIVRATEYPIVLEPGPKRPKLEEPKVIPGERPKQAFRPVPQRPGSADLLSGASFPRFVGSQSNLRPFIRQRPGALVGVGGSEDGGVTVAGADDLEADGQTALGEAAGHGRGRLARQVERVAERRPSRPAVVGPTLRHLPPGLERRDRQRRRQHQVVRLVEPAHPLRQRPALVHRVPVVQGG